MVPAPAAWPAVSDGSMDLTVASRAPGRQGTAPSANATTGGPAAEVGQPVSLRTRLDEPVRQQRLKHALHHEFALPERFAIHSASRGRRDGTASSTRLIKASSPSRGPVSAIGSAASAPIGPTASITSSAFVTSVASGHCRSTRWHPADSPLVTGPGTARTGLPSRRA